MLPMLADENFNNDIIRGVRRRLAAVDIVRVQDVGLAGADDPTVLKWAAENDRIVLTHDVSTMTRFAYDRVREGKPMPGVIEVSRKGAKCQFRSPIRATHRVVKATSEALKFLDSGSKPGNAGAGTASKPVRVATGTPSGHGAGLRATFRRPRNGDSIPVGAGTTGCC